MDEYDEMSDSDQLGEKQDGENEGVVGSRLFALRKFFGVVLLSLGVVLACWTAYMVYVLISDPDDVQLYRTVSAQIAKAAITVKENKVKLDIPSRFFGMLSVFLLLVVSSTLASTLITQGVNLVNLDMVKLVRKLDWLKGKIKNKPGK